MVRSIELTSQCLACQVPLAGPLSWPTRALGIHRSPDNPNLCSRCGNHLAAGEIRPVALVVLELEERLRFGDVDLEALAQRELPVLRQQLRERLEQKSALVMPADADHPYRLQCYFNAPVAVDQPEQQGFHALINALRWLEAELTSLGMQNRWRAVLTSGFVEVVPCEGPLQCFPMGEVTFRASELLERLRYGQLGADLTAVDALQKQDSSILQALDSASLPAQRQGPELVVLIDRSVDESLTPLPRVQSGAVKPPVTTGAQLGALLLALIAAPCAAMVVLAPGAVVIGLGSVMAVLLPLWKVVGMSVWPRVLITLIAVIFASLNWIRAELAQKRFRRLQRQVGGQLQLPQGQRRRLRLIRWTSIFVLGVVLLEGLLRVLIMKMALL